jgi:hypothetical protein
VIDEDPVPWVARYRLAVTEEATPALDELILRAASRRAVRVRTVRRSLVVVALVSVLTWPFWGAHENPAPQVSEMSGYGRQEGATRYYLLTVGSYTGPGSMERKK